MYYAPHCTFDSSAGNLLYNALRAHKYYALVSAVHSIRYIITKHHIHLYLPTHRIMHITFQYDKY